MSSLNFTNNDGTTLAKAKANEFNHTGSHAAGNKTQFSQIPAFYLGSKIKEHYPYKKDKEGKKIPKKDSNARYQEYEKETTSDGWIFSLRTPGRDPLYVVVREKPSLELGSFYLVSGLGYGSGQYPTYVDEAVKLELSARLAYLDNTETVVNEGK